MRNIMSKKTTKSSVTKIKDPQSNRKKVSVIGMGYVGLCLTAGLSKFGTEVYCVDVDKSRIDQINQGNAPIHEPQLPELISDGVKNNLIHATTDISEAIKNTDVTFISVGTPCNDSGYINLEYIKQVSLDIGKALKGDNKYHVISVKSTVIPGTTDTHVIPNIEKTSGKRAGLDFGVCMTPEFLKEGDALNDFFYPDKIVIGSLDKKSSDMMYDVFSDFHPQKFGKDVFLFCDLRTAEMIKYAHFWQPRFPLLMKWQILLRFSVLI
jgi:UDPglucose 6-dehydrogenase